SRAAPAQKWIIAGVEDKSRGYLAFRPRSGLQEKRTRGRGRDIEELSPGQRICQSRRRESPNRLSALQREAIIPLGVNGTIIVCFVVKEMTPEEKTPIEEIWFRQRKNNIFSARAVLDAKAKFLTDAGEVR